MFLKEFFEKVNFEKNQQTTKKNEKLPSMQCFLQVVKALHYLHTELHVIHRDVKPSNILINRKGQVKICDFGISGHLVDSVAKTIEAGCKPYMAVSIFSFIVLLGQPLEMDLFL